MAILLSFLEYLTQEQDKLVQMGTIKASKDQVQAVGVQNSSKGKQKEKNLKQPEKKKQDKPKNPDGDLDPSKDKDKKGKGEPNVPISKRDGIQRNTA